METRFHNPILTPLYFSLFPGKGSPESVQRMASNEGCSNLAHEKHWLDQKSHTPAQQALYSLPIFLCVHSNGFKMNSPERVGIHISVTMTSTALLHSRVHSSEGPVITRSQSHGDIYRCTQNRHIPSNLLQAPPLFTNHTQDSSTNYS